MRLVLISVILFGGVVLAQSTAPPPGSAAPQPSPPPDTVVATFGNGQKLTIGELNSFVNSMPPQMQQTALRDRKAFIQQFALMHRLAEMAEQAKLDQRSPTKESLTFNRMYLMMNAELQTTLSGIEVPPADVQAFYEKNKDRYSQVKVKAIYITFAANPGAESGPDGKKHLTEAEAKAKAEKLRGEIVGGADFVKLVKQYSEDKTSAAKEGDFGTIRHTDNLPDAIRQAIFGLKAGEVSQPVRQPNGFYLFRAEEITAQPFSEVQADISEQLRQVRFKDWMDSISRSLNLKFENESFFSGGGSTPAGR